MSLSGKVAIVTGGAMGIGYAVCEALSARGASIVVADKSESEPAAEKLRRSGAAAIAVSTDVAVEQDVAAMVEAAITRYGRLDILVNNAAIFSTIKLQPFEEISVADWRRILDVNVVGQFLCCRAALPHFKRQAAGRIINISSGVAFKGNPHMLHYVATKGAIVSMTRALATELGPHGVLVNSVAPGFTLSDGVNRNASLLAGVQDFAVRTRAIQREMLATDVVGAVAFFAGEDSAFITGQTLVVDGGAYYH